MQHEEGQFTTPDGLELYRQSWLPEGSRIFFENATAHRKARYEYPGFRHEVFNEIGKEQVFADIEAWLEPLL